MLLVNIYELYSNYEEESCVVFKILNGTRKVISVHVDPCQGGENSGSFQGLGFALLVSANSP